MSITETLRQRSLPARDRISALDKRIEEAEARRKAAEERVKRAGTEITRQRTLETERKRALSATAEKVANAQRDLDDLERRRQQALDALIRCQEEHGAVSGSLRDAQAATQSALAGIRKEQESKQDAEAEIARIRDERRTAEERLHQALMESLDLHLEQQAALLQTAFETQEQRFKARKTLEDLKKARHTDAEIGRLCDERDEIRKLLGNVMVPGVKAMLQRSLTGIEETLAKRFPGALLIPDVTPKDNQIEELLFYCDREGKAVCLLPVATAEWSTEASPTERASRAMCLVWSMIRELGLRNEDGDFEVLNGRSVFASQLDLEDIASQGFSVKCEGTEVIRYVFAAVPTELQEAVSHEDQDD